MASGLAPARILRLRAASNDFASVLCDTLGEWRGQARARRSSGSECVGPRPSSHATGLLAANEPSSMRARMSAGIPPQGPSRISSCSRGSSPCSLSRKHVIGPSTGRPASSGEGKVARFDPARRSAGASGTAMRALSHGVDSACVHPMVRVVPEQLECPPVTNSATARRRRQTKREQLRHVVLSDLHKPILRLSGSSLDPHEVAVVASRPSPGRPHDLRPRHGLEVLELWQDLAPPHRSGRGTPTPIPRLVHDAECPHDRLAIVHSRVAARGGAGLLAFGGKCARPGPLRWPSGHGRRYRLP